MAGRKPGTQCRYKCYVCGVIELASGGGIYSRCTPCKESNSYGARPADPWLGKDLAASCVQRAIKAGTLAHPKELTCSDCGDAATEYEHRDYNKPLEVVPICRGCNLVRGPAIPLDGTVERLLEHGRVPYVLGVAVAKLCRTMGAPHLAINVPKKMSLADWRLIWPELCKAKGAPKPTPEKAEAGA